MFINQWFCCAILCKTNGLRSSLSFGRMVRILPSNDMEVMFVSVDMIVASDVWTWEEVRKLVPRTDPERKHFIRICLSISLIMSSSLIFCAGLIRQLNVFPNLTLQFTIIMLSTFKTFRGSKTWWGYHLSPRFSSWYTFHLFPSTSILLEIYMVWVDSLYSLPLVWGLTIKPLNVLSFSIVLRWKSV